MTRTCVLSVLCLLLVLTGVVQASERTGVYVLVDEVILEPQGDKPERILIRGVFMNEIDRRVENPSSSLREPRRGWMAFKLAKGKEYLSRLEWKELKGLAGKGNVVAFGSMDALELAQNYWVSNEVKKDKPTGEPKAEYPVNLGLYLLRKDSEPAKVLKAVP
jgi:hypothetical protein